MIICKLFKIIFKNVFFKQDLDFYVWFSEMYQFFFYKNRIINRFLQYLHMLCD